MFSVRLLNTSGSVVQEFDSWRSLNYSRELNDVGEITFSINDSSISDLFTLDSLIEIYQQAKPGSWRKEETFFHRTSQHQLTERDTPIFTSYGKSANDLLRRRIIAYYATTAFTLKSDAVETVLKEFVEENLGPSALVANGRLMPGVFPGFSVARDLGRGGTWTGQYSYKNLLDVIKEIAESIGIDYDVKRTTDSNFEFECYYPQYGTDRSSYLTFSTGFGNMATPSYTYSRTEEITQVLVLGGDQETSRKNIYRQSSAISDSPWNIIEDTVSNNQEDGGAPSLVRMRQTGDDKLEELKAKESFQFEVLQTDKWRYGRDYFLGDLVNARFNDIERTMKIIRVDVTVSEGKESISLEFKTV